MMKDIKILFLLLLAPFFVIGQSSPLYTNNIEPLCWSTPGGVDSTIYVAWMSSAGTTRPSRLHYFNVSGNAVTVSGGQLRSGYCSEPTNDSIIIRLDSLIFSADINLDDNDTVIVRLDSFLIRLDSLITNTHEPQICDCDYLLDQKDWSWSIDAGSQHPNWNATRFVTRNCGGGDEIVFSAEYSEPKDLNISMAYTNNGVSGGALVSGSGYIDSLVVFLKNPLDTLTIWLHPDSLATKYPGITFPGSQLIYNSGTITTWVTSVTSVLNQALNTNAASNFLPNPQRIPFVTMSAGGIFRVGFEVVNIPSSYYANIRHDTPLATVLWHPSGGGAAGQTSSAVSRSVSAAISTVEYTLPCDTTIYTSYSDNLVATSGVFWDSIALSAPTPPSVVFAKGSGTCSMPCPETPECFTICNDETQPVPVYLVGAATDTCMVANITEFPVTASANSVSLAANYYHAVSIAVTSGTVVVSMVNSGTGVTSASFASGQTFNVSAAECELLKTGFGINATAGAAIVSTIR